MTSQLGDAHDVLHSHHLLNREQLTQIRVNTCIKEDKVKLTSPTGMAVYADSTPPVADEDERKGWLFKKAAADAAKFNYYFYATGSHPLTLASLNSVHMTCAVDSWAGLSSAPFIVVYTKATGSGDAGSWYKSRVAYALSSTKKIVAGELVNMYCRQNPQLNNGNRDVELETKITTGTADPSEEILTISVQSDSASAMGTKILVSHLGYELNNEIKRNISLLS